MNEYKEGDVVKLKCCGDLSMTVENVDDFGIIGVIWYDGSEIRRDNFTAKVLEMGDSIKKFPALSK